MKQKGQDDAYKKKAVYEALSHEHGFFKNRILSGSKKSIYNSCGEIVFYESVYEYFKYNEDIEGRIWTVLYNEVRNGNSITDELYRIYLKNEHLQVNTWDDIRELVEVYIETEKGLYAA